MSHDKEEALRRLDSVHQEILADNGLNQRPLITAEQVHGSRVAVVEKATMSMCFDDCDALVTDDSAVSIGIYVADCCAVFIVDPIRSAIGLVHSGKKGTELGVVANAIKSMTEQFGSRASD